jgi:hypothetical protein
MPNKRYLPEEITANCVRQVTQGTETTDTGGRGADRPGTAGSGDGNAGYGGLPEDRCIRAIHLPVEEEVHGDGDR